MKLAEFIDERGDIHILNIEAICELERVGEDRCRFYMVTPACKSHTSVFFTTPEEVATMMTTKYPFIQSFAAETRRERDAESALEAKIA